MNRRVFAVVATFFVISGVAACASKVPRPTPVQLEIANQRWPDATLENLEEGRRLYVRRCSSCYNLPLPTARTVEEWPPIIEDMGEYAQFDEHQTDLVLRYVISARETPPRAPGVNGRWCDLRSTAASKWACSTLESVARSRRCAFEPSSSPV